MLLAYAGVAAALSAAQVAEGAGAPAC
jgi:hypothetical protein